jgi:enamine deaminase RidA (YjgF/YER057c/UK114 family)
MPWSRERHCNVTGGGCGYSACESRRVYVRKVPLTEVEGVTSAVICIAFSCCIVLWNYRVRRNRRLTRINISSGYAYEDVYGYARAVRVGDMVLVSGTTARGARLDGDAYTQMMDAIVIVTAALSEAGAELRHVVRTVVYIRDMADADHVARAHRENFGAVRPASTLVQVAALTPATARVEIEVTAIIHH